MTGAAPLAEAVFDPNPAETLVDPRFRALLSRDQWALLPPAIRRRFSKRLAGGESSIYRGRVLETRMSWAGRWLARGARLIGGPLPLTCDKGVAAVVTVTEDGVKGGQTWTRLYVRRDGFPQIIHSAKRFAGPTGLEEHVGFGVGMALQVDTEPGALLFRSAAYFVDLGSVRLILPRWAWPGMLTVTHREIGGGRFLFVLGLQHPRLGELIHQTAEFEDA